MPAGRVVTLPEESALLPPMSHKRRFRFANPNDVPSSQSCNDEKLMYVMVSWILGDGSLSVGTELPGFNQAPAVGDTIVQPFTDGFVDACEVVERYIYFADDNEVIWHLILKHVELKPGRRDAFHLVTMIED